MGSQIDQRLALNILQEYKTPLVLTNKAFMRMRRIEVKVREVRLPGEQVSQSDAPKVQNEIKEHD